MAAMLLTAVNAADTVYQCDYTMETDIASGLSKTVFHKDFLRAIYNDKKVTFSFIDNEMYTFKFIEDGLSPTGVKYKLYKNKNGVLFAVYGENASKGMRGVADGTMMGYTNCTEYKKDK